MCPPAAIAGQPSACAGVGAVERALEPAPRLRAEDGERIQLQGYLRAGGPPRKIARWTTAWRAGCRARWPAGPFLAVWAAMSVAMMLPSALPLLRLDFATERSRLRTGVLASGYVSVWIAAGVALLALDRARGGRLLMTHGRITTAALLAAAALYQLPAAQGAAASRAAGRRSPGSSSAGATAYTGAARMGVENGLWCAGCCVGLMAALLAVGMMSVAWMARLRRRDPGGEDARASASVASRLAAAALAAGAVVWAL